MNSMAMLHNRGPDVVALLMGYSNTYPNLNASHSPNPNPNSRFPGGSMLLLCLDPLPPDLHIYL